MITALSEPSVRLCHLLELDLSPTVYLTDAAVQINWNGNTYFPSAVLSFSDIGETMDMALERVTVALSGVDQTIIAVLLLYEYINRAARLRRAMLTEELTVIADPNVLIAGRLDSPLVATDPESGTCTASIDIVSRWTPLGHRRGRYTNTEHQALFFSTDRGFDDVAETDEVIIWGKAGHYNRPIRNINSAGAGYSGVGGYRYSGGNTYLGRGG
jgi:hypothetical protein